jgi:anti-anti-sigma factor
MNIEVTEKEGYSLAALHGVLDDSSKQPFDELLHPIIAGGGGRLLIDLSGAERITSAGIGHLVTLVSRANTKGSRIVFANPTPFVKSVFAVTLLDRFLDIAGSADEAMERLTGR